MKLSTYAKQLGVNYQTAWRYWKAGMLNAYQLPTGTVIVKVSNNDLESGLKKKGSVSVKRSSAA